MAAPDYQVVANPAALTIVKGSSGSTTITFTPTGGYNGTIALTCTNLPTNTTCAFDQSQVTIDGKTTSVTTGLTIKTTAQAASNGQPSLGPLYRSMLALAFWCPGGFAGLAVMFGKRKRATLQRTVMICLLMLGSGALALTLSGCGGGSMAAPNSAKPPSTTQVAVVSTGTSGATVTTKTMMLSLTVTN